MKKLMEFGLSLVFLAFLLLNLVYAVKINEMNVMVSATASAAVSVRINEVELNPDGIDSGHEWIELYSEREVNLNGWKLVNSDNQSINLEQSFNGYLIINFSSQWLDNSNEKITLKNNESVISETIMLSDSYDDNRTWQYCNGDWRFTNLTRGLANSCSSQNQSQNQTQNNNQNNTSQQEAKIYLEMDWDEDEIVNGEEFEIEVKAFNLKSEDYDAKISITDDSTLISEVYNENEDKWKSSVYYLNGIFSGPGNKTETFRLRIKESYRDFVGDAKINVRIRKSGTSTIAAEIEKDIEILEKEVVEEDETQKSTQNITKTTTTTAKTSAETSTKQTGSVIRLGNRSKLQQEKAVEKENVEDKGNVLYESASEKMKKYAIYAVNIILIVIVIVLLKGSKDKKKRRFKKEEN